MGDVTEAPVLGELVIGDEPDAWAAAGFAVDGDTTWIGSVRIRLVGGSGGRGIRSWGLSPLDGATSEVDGLPSHGVDAIGPPQPAPDHPIGVVGFDHLVVASPDLDRTLERFTELGLDLRRTRDVGTPESPRRQLFFWIGEPILELVGPATPSGDGPSRFFGVTATVADIDATAALLGEGCGRVKDAVQPGRRITTLRHESFGMSVPVALMSPHVAPASPP